MQLDKITDNLKTFLENNEPEKAIEVVIELAPVSQSIMLQNSGRNEKIANIKSAFNTDLQPVADEISNQGGNILDAAWLNQTVKASVPMKAIAEIARLKEVTTIDLPARIKSD